MKCTRNILNSEKKIKKIMKARNIKEVKGSFLVVKSIEEKGL